MSRGSATLAVLGLALGIACSQRIADDPMDARVRCSVVTVFIESVDPPLRLTDPKTGGPDSWVCTCSTTADLEDPEYREMINEMAYERCLEVVAFHGHEAEDSSCLDDYESNHWGLIYGLPEMGVGDEPRLCGTPSAGCGVE